LCEKGACCDLNSDKHKETEERFSLLSDPWNSPSELSLRTNSMEGSPSCKAKTS
jgi:hypothetical protein